MADENIYWVAASNNTLQWGHRVYYSNCQREGGNYGWFQNNLKTAKGSPKARKINAKWVFGKSWRPEKNS